MKRELPAETITVTIAIRPTYDYAEGVKREIVESLDWLTADHRAIRLDWHDGVGAGTWVDDDGDES